MAKEETNKIKLVRIEDKVDCITNKFDNHLEHHKRLYDKVFRIFLVALSPIVAVVIWALVLVFKSR